MSVRAEISDSGVHLRFFRGETEISPDAWALTASPNGHSGIDALRRFQAQSRAVVDETGGLLEHEAVAALSPAEAAALGLPPPADVVLTLTMRGVLTDAAIEVRWTRPDGLPVLSAQRSGAFIRIGVRQFRLPVPLFSIARALDDFQSASMTDPDERMRRLVVLKAVLPDRRAPSVTASGMLITMKIAYAEAFHLDTAGDGSAPRIAPILHRTVRDRDDDPEEPDVLLPEVAAPAFDPLAATPQSRRILHPAWFD